MNLKAQNCVLNRHKTIIKSILFSKHMVVEPCSMVDLPLISQVLIEPMLYITRNVSW